MGQQVGFYANSEDSINLLEKAENLGLVGIPAIIYNDPEEVIIDSFSPQNFGCSSEQDCFYLIPDTLSTVEAFYEEIDSDVPTWRLMDYVSPVIQFKPSLQKDNCINNGRIYFNMESDDPRYLIVEKKYIAFSKIIRKWRKTDRFGFHVGPNTAEMATHGEIILKHLRHDLKVL